MPVDEIDEEMPAEETEDDAAPESEAAPPAPPAEAQLPSATAIVSAEVDQTDWRTWTDATGRHQTRAVLVSVDLSAGKVSLRKENGKRIGVPLDRLSTADQEFIRTLSPAVASATR